MVYMILATYLLLGVVGIVICLRLNRKHRVDSLFRTGPVIGSEAIVIVLCLWPFFVVADVLEIPRKRRKKVQELAAKRAQRSEARREQRLERARRQAIIGETGEAVTPLGLSGKVRIGGVQWNAISEGEYIDSGEDIVVVSRSANEVVVRRTENIEEGRLAEE